MEWLKTVFSEANGEASSMRVLVALVVVSQIIQGMWVCYHTKALPPMDWSQLGTIVGPLAVKAWQKGKESTVNG